jgi:hypothetical protein
MRTCAHVPQRFATRQHLWNPACIFFPNNTIAYIYILEKSKCTDYSLRANKYEMFLQNIHRHKHAHRRSRESPTQAHRYATSMKCFFPPPLRANTYELFCPPVHMCTHKTNAIIIRWWHGCGTFLLYTVCNYCLHMKLLFTNESRLPQLTCFYMRMRARERMSAYALPAPM